MSFKHQHVSLCGLLFRYTHKPQMRQRTLTDKCAASSLSKTQSRSIKTERYFLRVAADGVTVSREGRQQGQWQTNVKKKSAVGYRVCSSCESLSCVWMFLAPLFHNTRGCTDRTCDTDRFMVLLRSTHLYSAFFFHVCIRIPIRLWVQLLEPTHVFVWTSVWEKRPYGMQNVLADDSRSGFDNKQSGILCNRKRQMKNKESADDGCVYIFVVKAVGACELVVSW